MKTRILSVLGMSCILCSVFILSPNRAAAVVDITAGDASFGVDFGCSPDNAIPPTNFDEDVFFEDADLTVSPSGATSNWHGWGSVSWAVSGGDGGHIRASGGGTEGFNNSLCGGGAGWLYGRGNGKFSVLLFLDRDHPYTSVISGNVKGAISNGTGTLKAGIYKIEGESLGNSSQFSLDIVFLGAACSSSDPLFFANSVQVGPPRNGNRTMVAEFTPNNGCTLNQVATAFGYDHFNWLQLVTNHPDGFALNIPPGKIIPTVLTPPFFDPAIGGGSILGGVADLRPFYWDEATNINDLNQHLLPFMNPAQANTTLEFIDSSSWPSASASRFIGFTTALVGVKSDGTYDVLYVFKWKTSFNGTVGGVTRLKNVGIPDENSGTGEIFDVVTDVPFESQPAVADAGADIPITNLGTVVGLDGGGSFDPEGDPITFQWTLTQKPLGSEAVLVDASGPTPSFIADVHGDYVISLVVTDSFGLASQPDELIVSLNNVAPVANAGPDQPRLVGDVVLLDGKGSSDGNGDLLTYKWSILSQPVGSEVIISNSTENVASIVPDIPGTYIIQLIVNDGFLNSQPDAATITVAVSQSFARQCVVDLLEYVQQVAPGVFRGSDKNPNGTRNAMLNAINGVISAIDNEDFEEALNGLQGNQILRRTDSCVENGQLEGSDWVRDCSVQTELYGLIQECITLLEGL